MPSRVIPDLEGLAAEPPESLELALTVLRHSNRTRGRYVLLMMSAAFLLGALVRGGVHRG